MIFGSLGATPYVEVRWVGNENGIAGDPCFATINAYDLEVENRDGLNHGTIDGDRFIPAEADVSIRPGWFYHAEQDAAVRSPKNLVKLWFHSIGKNAGLLLNLPPDRRGLVHDIDAQNLIRFHEILTKSTAVNLAQHAKIWASSVRNANCTPDMLLVPDAERYYAPQDGCLTPVLEFSLDTPVTFNVVKVSEVIELGHKICGFEVSVQKGRVWETVFTASCMGNCQAAHFDTVTTKKIRLTITEAVDVPAIRTFALYLFDETLFTEEAEDIVNKNLMEFTSAKVETCGMETVADLGGIFPYNRITFDSAAEGIYELYIFNGSTYELVSEGDLVRGYNVCCIDTVIDSYKFKLKADAVIKNIAVFCK